MAGAQRLSVLSDKRAICEAIAGPDLCLTPFEFQKCQYLAGPFGTLTPVCAIYFRKTGEEYRIDYDQFLTVWRDEEVTINGLKRSIKSGDHLWLHNVYPLGFTLATITENKQPLTALVERIRTFLLEHAKDERGAFAFAQAGETEFLRKCRLFKSSEYEERLLARLA
jgi:hypothetical protein